MNTKYFSTTALFACLALLGGCDASEEMDGAQSPTADGKADDAQGGDEDADDKGEQDDAAAELTADINGALEGATPWRIEHYCNNGDNDSVPQGDTRVPVGCRTVILYQDADGVPVLDNDDPSDDVIMDGFKSGERQVCATAWFYRNGRTLDSGLPSWTIARDSTCDGTDNIVIDGLDDENLDVELTFDNDDNDIPFRLPGLTVVELNADGTTTARMSSFHFTDAEVSLQNFEGTDETDLELTLDRHYWHAPLDQLP